MTNPQDQHSQDQYPQNQYTYPENPPANQGYGNQGYSNQDYGNQGYAPGSYNYVPPQGNGFPGGYQGQSKNKILAAVLAFFLGGFGVHNFYLGYNGRGATQLILTIVGYLTVLVMIGFLFLGIVWLWAFIEFVMILLGAGGLNKDAKGVPLST